MFTIPFIVISSLFFLAATYCLFVALKNPRKGEYGLHVGIWAKRCIRFLLLTGILLAAGGIGTFDGFTNGDFFEWTIPAASILAIANIANIRLIGRHTRSLSTGKIPMNAGQYWRGVAWRIVVVVAGIGFCLIPAMWAGITGVMLVAAGGHMTLLFCQHNYPD
ncbi:MAG: hypothetical protein A2391_01130 [Candidatus Brennerbacteria bacterium RIFOXYB1_FULL_41_13]|uniref:Uncharacterized protein n=1 Tax=Candidatus Brennerbacteria bacterium RIFOXYD1_FULL_41_16 TaxID=1797529 RepID=A0A1G1XLA1_9BACT|nr:MAG: hypothetical protein A2391_01130 [Candidatus Brennerbacteria bacterium RIFOXYB1_FULL_41_13]OGY40694.1 MAG: hypothetical protein A2570_00995 [Candidatus Brennerbacteria bacterium RIFOXYD1_FULL_41_16]